MIRSLTPALVTTVLLAGTAWAENVEIHAIEILDNTQNGYCIDISGGQGPQANPDNGLQGHTCYSPSGAIFVDQAFDDGQFADGILYMPEFDVCMQVSELKVGAAPELAACDGSEAQSFVFSGEGTITPAAAPDLCLTLGADTRFGRSQTNQIKDLALATCSTDQAAFQTWGYRTAE